MLGPKIREIRQQEGLTLNELADKTGLTASYLSQIERNIIDPSLSSLRKISVELKVPIYTFLTDEKKQNVLIQANKRKKLELPNSSIVYEFVTPMASDKEVNSKMEIIYFQLEPFSWSSDEFMVHPADECIFIIEGTAEIYLAEEKYILNKGDSIYIQENIPHRFYNPTSEKIIGVSSICPPIY
ncbi:helix-turn-helix domain-containing protein [Clostridium thailandense]|uniref:Helix-turn-helix domain-containing protein n=1 Tax=Clostridium thailandense TaxID=2794346 RepID=A0A949TNP9_9CLOT|nr:helix-turn-helix domain-containing protein [Clostridium thailandense]MBV7273797.1 helix-turn-helix domain-containing protein [Clostridium thailandense]